MILGAQRVDPLPFHPFHRTRLGKKIVELVSYSSLLVVLAVMLAMLA